MWLNIMFVVGVFLLVLVSVFERKYFRISLKKVFVVDAVIAVSAIVGWRLMFIIESGFTLLDGWSFFGSLFFTPPIMILTAKLIKVPIADILDMAAPCEAMILALSKAHCWYTGCCSGKVLYQDHFRCVIFPSQAVECMSAVLLMVFLLYLMKRGNNKGTLYAQYMIIYGLFRSVLQLMREPEEPFVWFLQAGSFWALISLLIGQIWLYTVRKKNWKGKPRAKIHKKYHK